jgi:hypothetical protein
MDLARSIVLDRLTGPDVHPRIVAEAARRTAREHGVSVRVVRAIWRNKGGRWRVPLPRQRTLCLIRIRGIQWLPLSDHDDALFLEATGVPPAKWDGDPGRLIAGAAAAGISVAFRSDFAPT